MKITLKKLLCGILSASMLITSAVIPSVASAEGEVSTDELLMNITFDETGAGSGSFNATEGGAVTEKGTVAYTDVYKGNKALSIETNAAGNYLELPKGILNGKEAASFAFKIKPGSGWPFMTTPVSSQTYLSEKYLGMLATSSTFTAERYNNSGTRLSSVISNGDYSDWQHVAVVFEANGTKLYVNGELAKSDTATVNIAELFTETASTWIGHGNWGSGEGFSGMIDDFKIYGKALSEDEITALSSDITDYRRKALVYDNNCFVTETHFYEVIDDNNAEEIFSYGNTLVPITLKADVAIKNYTTNNDTFDAALFAVYPDGTEAQLTLANDEKSVSGTIAAGEETNVSLTVYTGLIETSGYEKIVARVKLNEMDTTCDASLYADVIPPQVAPADSNSTTHGAHDPSIVKFPNDDTYYAYSSHHLIFTSKDLINWKKYDYTNIGASTISPKSNSFISSNYTGTTMNGTYWAPDVYYKEGDDHPYWMYISLSCGLGGRNSVISLMKSDSPLFWADSNADIIDAGIVFATKETSGYITNAIDANIYTDSNDGTVYFIWGSFWGGIQAAKLTEDGFVEGIDYTSDTTILNTCKNFGTSVFTQKNGVAGPEGAWMIEHGDYRYMFTSYGWLGSNYNTRVARAPLSTPFSTNMKTQLVDANGVVMGTQQTQGSTSRTGITGYKLIGSYRLGDGTMTMTKDSASSGYYYSYNSDGAYVYYGPGHNSAISTDMGDFYVSHTRINGIEGAATLQTRRMLWTEDGWPVVSPIVYSGEVEQALPKDMLLGTYDLATVGYTKMEGSSINTGTNPNRNYDLPVVSSKVTLNADGTMADDLGTWEFDGDHKVTLTFTKDGDIAKDEFYKSGDVITMYALFGYDKDEKSPAIALTGTNQNHVTQFAKKLMTNTYESEEAKIITPIVVEKSNSGNPMLGFDANNNIMYAGDPAALVDGDTVYLYAGHDTSTGDSYVMPEWVCYSSKDMENWTYHGKVMSATDVSWRNDNNSAWASQAIKYGDKYYLYFCTWDKTSSGKQSIGVAVSDSPTGPFTDIGAPIVKGTLTEPQTSDWNDIDPTVWVETVDGVEHRYLAWGNGIYYVCELNEDMISVKDLDGDGSITMNGDIKQQEFKNLPDGLGFTEAPFIYRRQDENGNYYGKYYMFGAFGWREQMGYVTADSMYGPWEYGGTLMPPTATSNTNHPSVIDFNGKTYFIYHNGSLPWGSGFRRVVCVEEFEFNADGSIDPIQETSTGLTGTASIITQDDNYLYYEAFVNPSGDDSYPLSKSVYIGKNMADMGSVKWEIVASKADTLNENYVSIQAVNKPGLYLAAKSDYTLYLTADAAQNDTAMQSAMTFRTIAGLDGSEDSVTFESVSEPGYYITMQNGNAVLTKGKTPSACTFHIGSAENVQTPALAATVDKVWHEDNKTVHFRLNNALVYGTVNAIVAEYNTSGTLIGVANKNKIDVTSASQFIDIDYAKAEDTSTLKLFVWNHMMPVAPVTEVKATTSPYAMPEGCTSYFTFDEDLSDSLTEANGVFVASNIEGDITAEDVLPSLLKDGYKGKAIEFTGANSYGVNLGNVITSSNYTLAFRMKANAFTAFTSGVFIDSGSKTDEKWVSAPFGYQSGGSTMIWSKSGSTYLDIISNTPMSADTWHQVVIAADGTTGNLYIDGALVASGSISDIVTTTTNTYLGVNYWDTPFNGLIDDMYIYNGTTLTSEQIENLYFATR